MSGGVDSSVAALLLKQQGHEVIGVSMKLSDMPENPDVKTSGCCSVKDFNDARCICDSLGIPFYAMNFKEQFKEKVMNNFVSEYLKGRTPNPCVLCNQEIKFDAFLKKAEELGADYVATGHYARIKKEGEEYSLLKGTDPQKDQTYFLFSLGQKELSRILFPVGDLTKPEVRRIAHAHQLKTKDKPESQEVCFVPNDDPGAFIDGYVQKSPQPPFSSEGGSASGGDKGGQGGIFIDTQGNIVGKHRGIHHYTLGQRRGIQVAMGKRFYVKSIDLPSHRITLSEDHELYQKSLLALNISWSKRKPQENEMIQAKIRYRHAPADCKILTRPLTPSHQGRGDYLNPLSPGGRGLGRGGDIVEVHFEEAQRAITPGQAIVFYKGEEVLGGGWIERGL